MSDPRIQSTERAGLKFIRKARASVSDFGRKVLNLPEIPPGLVGRVVNDVEDRVEKMKELGYMPFESKTAEPNGIHQTSNLGSVWNKSVGGGTRGVLMVIPREWYDENQMLKQGKIDETEAQLQRNAEANHLAQNLGNGISTSGISIKR